MRTIGAAIALTIGLAACGHNTSQAATYTQPSDIATAIGCANYQGWQTFGSHPDAGTANSGQCTLAGNTVQLYTFTDATQRANYLALAKATCHAIPGRTLPVVYGNTWLALFGATAGTQQAATATRGRLETLHC